MHGASGAQRTGPRRSTGLLHPAAAAGIARHMLDGAWCLLAAEPCGWCQWEGGPWQACGYATGARRSETQGRLWPGLVVRMHTRRTDSGGETRCTSRVGTHLCSHR
jgi:hypothetical protein